MPIDRSFWKLDETSLVVARLKNDMKHLKDEKKSILKDHRRLEIENTVLRARVARLELLGK